VHALLGNLPTKTTAKKRYHRKHDKILHATLIFTRTKKTVTTKTLATKNGLDQTKPQTNLNNNFWKPDTTKRQQRQWNRDNFTNSTYQNFCRKKASRFWEPRKPTTTKAEAAKQSQSKPTLTETWPKNLEANFRDSTKWTWNFADKKKTCWAKKPELENLLAENQTQTLTWKTPLLKNRFWISEPNTKLTLRFKDEFVFCTWLPNGLRYLLVGGRGQGQLYRKMPRRWILSFEAADSHQSSARCVGHGLEDSTFY
jgi:hypothetical protein